MILAHLVTTDLGPFYDGALHPLVTVDDMLAVVSVSILAAFAGRSAGRKVLVGLCGGWVAAIVLSYGLPLGGGASFLVSGLVLLALGGCGLLSLQFRDRTLSLVALALGFWKGVLNGAELHAAGSEWLSVIGSIVGLFALASIVGGSGAWLAGRGYRVILRVCASWIAAIGLLMIGWQLGG